MSLLGTGTTFSHLRQQWHWIVAACSVLLSLFARTLERQHILQHLQEMEAWLQWKKRKPFLAVKYIYVRCLYVKWHFSQVVLRLKFRTSDHFHLRSANDSFYGVSCKTSHILLYRNRESFCQYYSPSKSRQSTVLHRDAQGCVERAWEGFTWMAAKCIIYMSSRKGKDSSFSFAQYNWQTFIYTVFMCAGQWKESHLSYCAHLSQNGVYLPLCLSLAKGLEISFDCVTNSVTAEVE